MKNDEIIKALELCIQVDSDVCDKCPFYDEESGCLEIDLRKPALDLINRQAAEIKQKDTEIAILIRKKEAEELQLKNSELEIELKEMRLWDGLQKAEIEGLIEKIESLLCHASGGKLSKHTYPLKTMEISVSDNMSESYDEGYNDGIKDFAEEVEKRCVAGGIYPAFVRATIKRVKEEMTEGNGNA